jgi:hypothetical protein
MCLYTGEKILKAKTKKYFHRRTDTLIYYSHAVTSRGTHAVTSCGTYATP